MENFGDNSFPMDDDAESLSVASVAQEADIGDIIEPSGSNNPTVQLVEQETNRDNVSTLTSDPAVAVETSIIEGGTHSECNAFARCAGLYKHSCTC